MRVLFVSRKNLLENKGGDTVQILNTKEELEKLGVEVELWNENNKPDIDKFDIIHFFNLTRPKEILPFLNSKPKKVLSTIYVDFSEYERHSSSLPKRVILNLFGKFGLEYFKFIGRDIKEKGKLDMSSLSLYPLKKTYKEIVESVDYLLPNSNNEFKRLERDLGKINTPYSKINNGITILPTQANPIFKNAVISSGRVEGLKNQLQLVRALNELNYPAFIIGNPSTHHKEYYLQCKKEAKSHIKFIDRMDQKDLFNAMSAAKVHVLPSYFETTGLVSLEAAYYGSNIVITDRGDQLEYFKGNVEICEPDDKESIKKAIINAYNKPFNEDFKNYIEANHQWENAAKQTLEVYHTILENNN